MIDNMLLRRFKKNLSRQDWLAISIDLIVVVFGVFMGIQVANWNESLQLRSAELDAYKKLKEQISLDAQDISGQIEYNAHFSAQYMLGMEIIERNDRTQMKELAEIASQLTRYSDYDRRGNVYEVMVNSGDIRLIQNEQIIKSIIDLEETMMYMNRMEAIHYEAMMGYAIKAMKDVIKFSNGEVVKPEVLYSFEFQNLFFLILQITNEKDAVYKDVIRKIDSLNILLEQELSTDVE